MDGPSVLLLQISFEVIASTRSIIIYMIVHYIFIEVFLLKLGDGAVVRGRAYGVRSIRVDGNDALAMYSVVHTAREMAVCENRPILIEVK